MSYTSYASLIKFSLRFELIAAFHYAGTWEIVNLLGEQKILAIIFVMKT